MASSTSESRVLIASKDYLLDSNTLITGSGWSASSEANVKTNKFTSVAIASANSSSISIDLSVQAIIGVLTIPKHTLGINSTYRIRISNDVAILTSPGSVLIGDITYDSGTTNVWPSEQEYQEVPFAEYSEWSNSFIGTTYPAIAVPCIDVTAQYIHIEFNDPDYTDYTIAKITVGTYWRPSGGVSAGWQQLYTVKRATHKRLTGGGVFSEDRVRIKQLRFTLKTLKESEVFDQVAQIDKGMTKKTPWVTILDPGDSSNSYRMFMYGTNNTIKPIKNRFYGFYSKAYIIDEWI